MILFGVFLKGTNLRTSKWISHMPSLVSLEQINGTGKEEFTRE